MYAFRALLGPRRSRCYVLIAKPITVRGTRHWEFYSREKRRLEWPALVEGWEWLLRFRPWTQFRARRELAHTCNLPLPGTEVYFLREVVPGLRGFESLLIWVPGPLSTGARPIRFSGQWVTLEQIEASLPVAGGSDVDQHWHEVVSVAVPYLDEIFRGYETA